MCDYLCAVLFVRSSASELQRNHKLTIRVSLHEHGDAAPDVDLTVTLISTWKPETLLRFSVFCQASPRAGKSRGFVSYLATSKNLVLGC